MAILTIISAVIFFGFIALTIKKIDYVPSSYSSLYYVWRDTIKADDLNLFSVITTVVALLLVPPMIEAGEGSAMQFVGFFVPLYLLVVAMAPDYELRDGEWHTQRYVHIIGASLCAIGGIMWLIWIAHVWWLLPLSVGLYGGVMAWTKTYDDYVLWAELSLFTAVYVALMV